MFRFDTSETIWRYWAATLALLFFGLGGYRPAFVAVIMLSGIQVVHFLFRERRLSAFPVQVRIAYLLMMAMAYHPSLQWFYWVPAMGTTATVLFDYCPLARLLALAPWNRRQPLTRTLLSRVLFAAPTSGSILDLTALPSLRTTSGRRAG